jgi:acetone carboxylase gamma subunit
MCRHIHRFHLCSTLEHRPDPQSTVEFCDHARKYLQLKNLWSSQPDEFSSEHHEELSELERQCLAIREVWHVRRNEVDCPDCREMFERLGAEQVAHIIHNCIRVEVDNQPFYTLSA